MLCEPIITLESQHLDVNQAFRIALGDLVGNVAPHQTGLLDRPAAVILAGLDYDTPWTRDAAINVSNAGGLLMPAVARNTLLAVLDRDGATVRVGGQYWDAIIWVTGAWHYYLHTGDREFLSLAYDAAVNSLAYFEATEFDADSGLFRGPAVYGDGVSAYPDRYAAPGGYGDIREWVTHNADRKHPTGYGIPMQALSTNCVYYSAYVLANRMAAELGKQADASLTTKAAALRAAINEKLWDESAGRYRYFVDPWGGCDRQEGMGLALAILLGVADKRQTASILEAAHVTPAGMPCVWPTYERYQLAPGDFGRHSGTVWPHIQGFWGCAAAEHGRADLFAHELDCLTAHANRDVQFTEIYHPETRLPYGGLQECGPEQDPSGIFRWHSCRRQTWSATAYIRLVLMGLLGMRFDVDGLRFAPCVPAGFGEIRLTGLTYRDMTLDVTLTGAGRQVKSLTLDGEPVELVPAGLAGSHRVAIEVA